MYMWATASLMHRCSAKARVARAPRKIPSQPMKTTAWMMCPAPRRVRYREDAERRGRPSAPRLFIVVQQAEDVVLRETLAAFEEVEFDSKSQSCDFAAELLNELDRRFHGAAGGEQVVDENNALAGCDGVHVDLERVGAVFEIV